MTNLNKAKLTFLMSTGRDRVSFESLKETLNVSTSTLRRWVKKGYLRALKNETYIIIVDFYSFIKLESIDLSIFKNWLQNLLIKSLLEYNGEGVEYENTKN